MSRGASTGGEPEGELTQVIRRNIDALMEHRQQGERTKGIQERIADAVTRFTGSMLFVYIHLVLFGFWIIANIGWIPIKPFDESFVKLAMFASVEAIFLSTFVLISQNRMAALADKRADLDLQVGLLAEHEITRIIKLVVAIADKMGIEESKDPELSELARDVRPEHVMSELERNEEEGLMQKGKE